MSLLFRRSIIIPFIIACTLGSAQAQGGSEPMFQGRSLSSWVQSIQNRDDDMAQAFLAIRHLGPSASAAVPELARMLDKQFDTIRIGVDDDRDIAEKLADFGVRSSIVDSLGAIGAASAPAAGSLIHWALAKRVVPENMKTDGEYSAFVNLVALDVLERMNVVYVISHFRLEAAPLILSLITSNDKDERKLAVAILEGSTLPIATALLKSDDCRDRKLGVTLLLDLWPYVSTDRLIELKLSSECPVLAQRASSLPDDRRLADWAESAESR